MSHLSPIVHSTKWLSRYPILRHPVSFPRLRFSERRLLLAIGDLLAMCSALAASLGVRFLAGEAGEPWSHAFSWFALLGFAWLVGAGLANVYDLTMAAHPLRSSLSAAALAVSVSIVYTFVPLVIPPFPDRRFTALILPLAAALAVASWRLLYATIFIQPAFRQQLLIVGAGSAGRALAEIIWRSNSGYSVMGFVDDDIAKQGEYVAGARVLGRSGDLLAVLSSWRPDQVVLAITRRDSIHRRLFQSLLACFEMGIPVVTMDALYERLTGRVPVKHCGSNFQAFLPMEMRARERPYVALRRLVDILVGAVGVTLLALVVPFVWLANRIASPGPLFYWQERVGLQGRPFRILKLRSMIVDAERGTGAVWAQSRDPRITRVGQFLRKTRLDEIPQFVNVLRGDMSLIGPRPERPIFVEELTRQIPFYRLRHAVRPGITGWAQVRSHYAASVEDSLIKLEHDIYYIKHKGPFLDCLIVLRTVQVMLGAKGR